MINRPFPTLIILTIFIALVNPGGDSAAQSESQCAPYTLDGQHLGEVRRFGYGFDHHYHDNSTLAWDGNVIEARSTEGLWLFNETLEPQNLITDYPELLLWRPDGRQFLAQVGDTPNHTVGVYTVANRQLVPLSGDAIQQPYVFADRFGAWSSDGRLALYVQTTTENAIYVWDTATGESLARFPEDAAYIETLVWSPDGTLLVAGGSDGTIHVYDGTTGERLLAFTLGNQDVMSLVWYPDWPRLLGLTRDGTLFAFDYSTGSSVQVETLASDLNASGMEWSAGGSWLAIYNRTLSIISRADLDRLPAGEIPTVDLGTRILDVAWKGDGSQIAVMAANGTLSIWTTSEGRLTQQSMFDGGHVGWVQDVAWNPDGSYLASTGSDGTIRIYDSDASRPLTVITTGPGTVYSVAWSPQGNRLAAPVSNGAEPGIGIWSIPDGRLVQTIPTQDRVGLIDWHPNGNLIAAETGLGGEFETVGIWNVSTGEPLSSETFRDVTALRWNATGYQVFVGGMYGVLYVLPVSDAGIFTGREDILTNYLHVDALHNITVRGAAWRGDGDILATVQLDDDRGEFLHTITVWNTDTFDRLFEAPLTDPQDVIFSQDNSLILVADQAGWISVWDAHSGEKVTELPVHNPRAVALNPCAPILTVGDSDGFLHVFQER